MQKTFDNLADHIASNTAYRCELISNPKTMAKLFKNARFENLLGIAIRGIDYKVDDDSFALATAEAALKCCDNGGFYTFKQPFLYGDKEVSTEDLDKALKALHLNSYHEALTEAIVNASGIGLPITTIWEGVSLSGINEDLVNRINNVVTISFTKKVTDSEYESAFTLLASALVTLDNLINLTKEVGARNTIHAHSARLFDAITNLNHDHPSCLDSGEVRNHLALSTMSGFATSSLNKLKAAQLIRSLEKDSNVEANRDIEFKY